MIDLQAQFLYTLGQQPEGPKEAYDYFLMGAEFAAEKAVQIVKPGLTVDSKYSGMNALQAAWQSAEDRAEKIESYFLLGKDGQ